MSQTSWWVVYIVSIFLPIVGIVTFLWAMAGGVRPEERGGAWGALVVSLLSMFLWLSAL